MRLLGLLGVIAMVASGCKEAPSNVAADGVQREIARVLQQRLDALSRGDIDAYSAFFAEHLVYVDDDGKRMDKAALLKVVRGNPVRQHTETNFSVHSFGNVAVATYRESVADEGRSHLHSEDEITATYVMEHGHWLLAAQQETSIPFANHPAAQVDPAVYDEYAGDYRMGPDQIVTVFRQGDKLYEKWSDENKNVEDVPLSATAFVQSGEIGVVTFERNSSGKVARYVLHLNHDDLVGAKVR